MYSFIHNLLTSSSIICHQCFRIIENRLQILVGRYLLRFQVYPLFVVVVLGGGYCPSIIKNIYCWPLFSIDYCHYWLSIIKNPTIKNRRQLIIELLFSIVIIKALVIQKQKKIIWKIISSNSTSWIFSDCLVRLNFPDYDDENPEKMNQMISKSGFREV